MLTSLIQATGRAVPRGTVAQELELSTAGSFHVLNAVSEAKRCGLAGTHTEIAFTVACVSTRDRLDADGFIVDWQEIHDYFVNAFARVATFPSCEQIACQACHALGDMLAGRVHRIAVTIGHAGGSANVTARWAESGRPS